MTKHYARVLYPGLLFANHSTVEVKNRTDKPPMENGAFGWCFFDRESTVVNGEELLGKEKNQSGFFYIGNELSAAQAMKRPDLNSIAKSNIENNGYRRVVMTKAGQMFPLEKNDVVVGT